MDDPSRPLPDRSDSALSSGRTGSPVPGTSRRGAGPVEVRSILTPTGGYLAGGFTHTLNPYLGCGFGGSLCGTFCYAQHFQWIRRGRPWGDLGHKVDAATAYRRDHDRIRAARDPARRSLRIFMSSSTDPYAPQESRLRLSRSLLEVMVDRPPDALVLQTHSILVLRDLDLLVRLASLTRLRVSITIETDRDVLPGLPRHAFSPARRLAVLGRFHQTGIPTQATVSPLLPLADPVAFARELDRSCDRVILDHYLIGDGTAGRRTLATPLPRILESTGHGSWTRLEALWTTRDLMAGILGPDRVLIGCPGFNTP